MFSYVIYCDIPMGFQEKLAMRFENSEYSSFDYYPRSLSNSKLFFDIYSEEFQYFTFLYFFSSYFTVCKYLNANIFLWKHSIILYILHCTHVLLIVKCICSYSTSHIENIAAKRSSDALREF